MTPRNYRQDDKHSEDDRLERALKNVPIPDGLEQRILACIDAGLARPGHSQGRWTRRGWLTAAVAAGCSGAMIGGGCYAWLRRPIRPREVQRAILHNLTQRDWSLPWLELPLDRNVNGVPIPREVRDIRGWQRRSLQLGSDAVAFDVSSLGCVAVLFSMKTWRDLSPLPPAPPETPIAVSGQTWQSLAIWQQRERYLYALALRGSRRDYQRLLHRRGPATFA